MRGFELDDDLEGGPGRLQPWELKVVEAVGTVIEFWGFKRNQGRVWALLYLRGRPLSAIELQEELGLSKGAVSMVTRELEQWGVLKRGRRPGDPVWRFLAETDLMRMVGRVIREREAPMVARVRTELEDAEKKARADKATPRDVLSRIQRMRLMASLVDKALSTFLQTARLDVGGALTVLESDKPPPKTRTKKE